MSDICNLCDGEGYTYKPEYYDDGSVSRTVTQVPCSCSVVATDGEREALEKTVRDIIAVYHKTHLTKEAQTNAMVSVLQAAKASSGVPNQTDKARIEELETICAEAYQVVGLLSDFLPDAKLLDNLSQQKLVHTDVLPCHPKTAINEHQYGLSLSCATQENLEPVTEDAFPPEFPEALAYHQAVLDAEDALQSLAPKYTREELLTVVMKAAHARLYQAENIINAICGYFRDRSNRNDR
jgi:hypothetical protein